MSQTPQLSTDLYHYTSPEAFLGIFSSRTIWASRIDLLNDEKEYSYTVDLLLPHLEKLRSNINKVLLDHLVRLLSKSNGNGYVACFSEKPDLLSQWRAYCRDGGFSIGFKKDTILKISENQGLKLVKCVYDAAEQQQIVKEYADQLEGWISSKGSDLTTRIDRLNFYTKYVFRQVNELANTIKHPAFEEEAEWRLVKQQVFANDVNLDYRPGKGMLVPYFKINLLDPEQEYSFPPMSEIYVAPHKNAEVAVKTMESFLRGRIDNFNKNFIRVNSSVAPYREI